MRLIDADKLKYELFADNYNAKMTPQEVADCVDNQPTAYNTDKVVAELEASGQKMSEAKGNPWDSSDHKYYKAISVKKAISIVKAGGVE